CPSGRHARYPPQASAHGGDAPIGECHTQTPVTLRNNMSKHRRFKKPAALRPLEWLEDRRLLSGVTWDNVLTGDAPLGTNPVPSSGPVTGTAYTLRALVEYYNSDYAGASDAPFTIQLQSYTTYTLSDTTNASSVDGGRDNEQNQYGALDINPTQTTAPLVIQG